MKKIIKKFWGVALILVLLSTLLVGTIPQASASNLKWGYATLPGGTIGPLEVTNTTSITKAGIEIYDIAVANDGQTVYAATSSGGYKSTDQGRKWSKLYTADADLEFTNRVAVAPDDANIVAFLDTTNMQFGVSKTGGYYTTLHVADVEDGAGDIAVTVNDIDISEEAVIHGDAVHLVGVAGSTATGPGLFYLNYGVEFAGWDECVTSTAYPTFDDHFATPNASEFFTVKFSPSFNRDYVAYLVGQNGTDDDVYMDIVSFNSNEFNSGIPSYQYYLDTGVLLDDSADLTPMVRADLVFDPSFVAGDETTRYVYASATYDDTVDYRGGFYRVTDDAGPIDSGNIAPGISVDRPNSIWTLAINADGTSLVAAGGYSNITWTITDPKAINSDDITFTPSRVVKRSGGGPTEGFTGDDYQAVAYAGSNVVIARGGVQGAFALSTDNGYTFNDISFVNAYLDDIEDHVVAADGVKRYVVSWDANDDAVSIWYWDGTYWERTLTIATSDYYIAKASPNNFDVLYVADQDTAMIRYTATAGKVNWLERTCPTPYTSGLADFEVQDDTTLWVATNVSLEGCVTKVTETGNIWPVSGPYFNTVFSDTGTEEIHSLTLIGDDKVVVGGAEGHVAYTNDGTDWTEIDITVANGGTGNVYVTASSLGPYGIIYATENTANMIYYFWIGVYDNWQYADLGGFAYSMTSYDIAAYNGAVYYLCSDGAASKLGRALMPALGYFGLALDFGGWTFQDVKYSSPATVAVTTRTPDAIKSSADPDLGLGNKIWLTDTSGAGVVGGDGYYLDQIMCYTDSQAGATPELTSPKNGVLVDVNRETGVAYNTTLAWDAVSSYYYYEKYQLVIAYDADFTRIYYDNVSSAYEIANPYRPNVSVTVGPINGADIPVYYQPGETFYWKVRSIAPWYSGWSETWTINVQPIRNTIPELYSPANGGDVAYLKPGFSWTPMGAYVEEFHFQIAEDYAFTKIVEDAYIDASGVDGAGYGLTKNLVDGKQYFWHVQVSKPFAGDWSTVANFWVKLPKASTPIVITQTNVTLTATQPAATSVTVTAPVQTTETAQAYVWAIIIIGAVLVIAVIVLIFRTRKA